MIFDGYSIAGNPQSISVRFSRNAASIILPFLVGGDIEFLDYLRILFPAVSLLNLRPELSIGAKGNFHVLEYLEKMVSNGEKVSWQLAFEGACKGKHVDCAKKIYLKYKEEVERMDSMES